MTSKAPDIFSRYLDNPFLSEKLPPATSATRSTLSTLLNTLDALNEAWFSFSTDLSKRKEGLKIFDERLSPLRQRVDEAFSDLPVPIREGFKWEKEKFEKINKEIPDKAPDTMSALSGYYLNFVKFLEVLIGQLTLLP